jgi:hypothetical protein
VRPYETATVTCMAENGIFSVAQQESGAAACPARVAAEGLPCYN